MDVPSHLSHMVTQMGQVYRYCLSTPHMYSVVSLTRRTQFLDHDITLTPEMEVSGCCDDAMQEGCFPIDVSGDDFFDGEHGEVPVFED